MARVHKSLRIDATDAERVRALMADGESEAAAYGRVISAGLASLEGAAGEQTPVEGTEAPDAREGADGTSHDLVAALTAHVATLTAEVGTLRAQLEVKDGQISALTRITEQSQTLHAVAEHKALETAEAKAERRGLWARLFGR